MSLQIQHAKFKMETSDEGESENAARYTGDLQDLEIRLRQFIQSVDDQRNWLRSSFLFIGILALVAVLSWVGYSIYKPYTEDPTNTAIRNLRATVPVQIGDKTVILAVQIVGLKIVEKPERQMREIYPEVINPLALMSNLEANQPARQVDAPMKFGSRWKKSASDGNSAKNCSAEHIPAYSHSLEIKDEWLDKSPRPIGLPERDIVWAQCGNSCLGLEIPGDNLFK